MATDDLLDLGFEESALAAFSFVEKQGFKLVQQSLTLVRYESSTVFLNIYHDRMSFELEVEVGALKKPSQRLSLTDILLWTGVWQKEGFGQHVTFQVSKKSDVVTFVRKLAQLVENYAKPFLSNDRAAFEQAALLQKQRADDYVQEVSNSNIRSKAQQAWETHDYTTLIELYTLISDTLTSVETLRLAYARRRAGR